MINFCRSLGARGRQQPRQDVLVSVVALCRM
jgi:hypothetical protein